MASAGYTHWYSRFLAMGVPYGAMAETIARVQEWGQWCAEWARTAEEFERAGDAAREAGHSFSARDHYLAAAACYHYGEFHFVQDMDLRLSTLHRCVSVFQKAMPFMYPLVERVEIPFAGTSLPAYYCSAGGGRRPCVVQIQGLDSIKEVETYRFGLPVRERGLATLMFDGPGQSEAWERIKMDVRYEEAVSAVVDYLLTRPDVDPEAVGVVGVSLGGYLAMRAAVADRRIKAAVDLAGPFDMRALAANSPAELQRRFCLACGVETLDDFMAKMEGATLEELPGAECPTLIVHGDKDRLVPVEDAQRIHGWARGESQLAILKGGDHVCPNRIIESGSLIADWLEEHLGNR